MMLNLTELSSDPLEQQITTQLLRRIVSGDSSPGDTLLPARTLARRQHVNVASVIRAYEALAREGVVRPTGNDRYVVVSITAEHREEIRRRLDGARGSSESMRIEAEMETARQIQAALLPKRLPDEPWLSVAAYSKPSLTVGGDFHDVIELDDDRVAVVIADASGKGLAAAMMITNIHGVIRSEIHHESDIETTLCHVNDHLAEFSGSEKFATLFYGVLDRRSGVFEFANAGHDHPIVVRADGTSERLEIGGTVLGILPGAAFATARVTIAPGDLIFLYTDGVTETRNGADEEYGEERLLDILRRERDQAAQGVVDAVLADVVSFEAPGSLQDDRTLLVMQAKDAPSRYV